MLLQFPIQLGNFTATFEFYVWILVGTDVYIPHRKHRGKRNSCRLFSAVCDASTAHRNQFICL